jgi:hypothetical protein
LAISVALASQAPRAGMSAEQHVPVHTRKPTCYRARMSWILPPPLLLFAGIVALLPLPALERRPMSTLRLVAEAVVTALAVIALVWLAWVAL